MKAGDTGERWVDLRRIISDVIQPGDFKTYFRISLTVFMSALIVSLLIGYLQPQEVYESTLGKIMNKVTSNIDWSDNFSIMVSIWKNNLRVGLMMFVFTTLTNCIMTYIIYSVNGGVVGYVLSKHLNLQSIMLILPHGIIEIPAIFLFGWAGTKYNLITYTFFTKKENRPPIKEYVMGSLKLIGLGLVLLAVSAFIEAYITPNLANLV